MKTINLLSILILLSSCSDVTTSKNIPDDFLMPTPKNYISWWASRHMDKINESPKETVFYGDSITHQWEEYGMDALTSVGMKDSVNNYGFKADTTNNLIWRLNNGEFPKKAPKNIFLLIGINDTYNGYTHPTKIVSNINTIIITLYSLYPDTKIHLIKLLPVGSNKGTQLNDSKNMVNEIIPFLVPKYVNTVDFTAEMSDTNGYARIDLFYDGIHPNADGYKVMADKISKIIKGNTLQ